MKWIEAAERQVTGRNMERQATRLDDNLQVAAINVANELFAILRLFGAASASSLSHCRNSGLIYDASDWRGVKGPNAANRIPARYQTAIYR